MIWDLCLQETHRGSHLVIVPGAPRWGEAGGHSGQPENYLRVGNGWEERSG